jgi:hypothetical protein
VSGSASTPGTSTTGTLVNVAAPLATPTGTSAGSGTTGTGTLVKVATPVSSAG